MRRANRSAAVLGFFVCTFVAAASGRLGSADAAGQLQAAMLFVTSGRLQSAAPLGPGWIRTPRGLYCEPHDIGNTLLMLPAAALGHAVSPAPDRDVTDPPAASRLLVSLTYAVVCALGCWWMYLLFTRSMRPGGAFVAAIAFAAATPFIAYAKTTWDVLGGCCALIATLAATARLVAGARARSAAVAVGTAWGVVAAFRYSAAPFVAVAIAAAMLVRRDRIPRGHAVACASAAAIALAPSLVYNAVRTGSALRPATALPFYLETNNAISGDIVRGVTGVLLSPNRGLFAFAPFCLVVVLLPWMWSRLEEDPRLLIVTFGAAACAYVLFIGTLKNWSGGFGWGPRYLVPILPIAFYAAVVTAGAGGTRTKAVAAVLLTMSVVINVPAALVNWSTALAATPDVLEQSADRPLEQLTVFRELARGLAGRRPTLPPSLADDRERAQAAVFPDFWAARAAQRGRAGLAVALASMFLLATGAAWCGLLAGRTFRDDDRHAHA